MSRTRLDLVLPATPVVPGVSSRLTLADAWSLSVRGKSTASVRFSEDLVVTE